MYFLHSLVLDATADPTSHAAQLLRTFTFTVVAVLNPDGFTYSHEHSRLWRKNRQDVGGLLCKGECCC
jgi:extracellular matrix protein 14